MQKCPCVAFPPLGRAPAWSKFSIIALIVFAASGLGRAANLTNPLVDSYNVRAGTETFAAAYKFTGNSILVETAEAITNLGSDTIKLYLGSGTSFQEGITIPSNVTNLMGLVRDQPDYHQVLDMPFRHIIMWCYPLENSDEWWGGGYNATQGAKDYNEMYSLTSYLLTNYNNSGKTFYLGHWEGDGYLEVSGWTANPSMTTIQGMIGWLNNRQKAVDDAKAATAHTNVYVYNYAECNRVRDAMNNGTNNNERVINMVVPYVTNLDYLSYSSYDSQNLSTADLYTTLNYMESMLPTNKAPVVPGPRMWIGEYGWGGYTTAVQEPLIRAYIQRLLGWNYQGNCLPYILYWEMYSNYNPGGGTNYCLIDYQDNKVPAWYLHNYLYNDARMLVAKFNETNGRLPTDTEFTAMVSPLLNAPLSTPINLTINNAGTTMATNGTATVSGTVAQGVYGDTDAAVYVYYGPKDGGTVIGNWQYGRYAGSNSHFNPTTFSVTLANLTSQTNYYYRFYTVNNTTNAWAPATAQFSTATLSSADYGSGMEIRFAGYNRGETLTNFPVLVNLSTNLPGFSYRQFASASGGDLRFTDASGIQLIPFEMESWNTNGVSSVWVNMPALATTNDVIWAYWGNPAATNLPATATNGSVWPNYDLVWHFGQSGFPYADSTQQYPALSGVAPGAVGGMVGQGGQFNGSSTYMNAGAVTNLNNAFTISAWGDLSASANNIQGICANQKGGYGSAGFSFFVNSYNTANGAMLLDTGDGSNGSELATAAGTVSFNKWHQVTAAINRAGSAVTFYVDGTNAPIVSGNAVVSDFANNASLNFGRFTNSFYYFTGTMDEARLHAGVDDSNWVWASWMTVGANATLESYAPVVQQPPALTIGTGGAAGTFLSWPGSGVGFTLYTTINLNAPVVWTLATNQPGYTNNEWQLTLPTDEDVRFYRLKSQ